MIWQLDDINKLNRFQEPPKQGLFCDILWSDPVDNDKGEQDSAYKDGYKDNEVRGCSYVFGYFLIFCLIFHSVKAVNKFMDRN